MARTPTEDELAHCTALLGRFLSAGLDPRIGSAPAFLAELFSNPQWWDQSVHTAAFEDLLWHRVHDTSPRFPMRWWHDTPDDGFLEMGHLLKSLGVKGWTKTAKTIRPNILRSFETAQDKRTRFMEVSEQLVGAANTLLAASSSPRRLHRFASPNEHVSPHWMVLTTQQHGAILEVKLLSPFVAAPPLTAVTPYERPKDNGEIDFDNFPSGDEPF